MERSQALGFCWARFHVEAHWTLQSSPHFPSPWETTQFLAFFPCLCGSKWSLILVFDCTSLPGSHTLHKPLPALPTSHTEGLWVVVTAKCSCTQVTHHTLLILQGWGCASCSCGPSPPTQPQAPRPLYDIRQTNHRDPSFQPEFFHCFLAAP